FTPKVEEDTILPFFNTDTLNVEWNWVDKDASVVDTNYGAAECSVQVSTTADFDPGSTLTGSWVNADDGLYTVDITSFNPGINKDFYRRVMARDKWGNPSFWSDEYFGMAKITYDNLPPAVIDNIVCSTRAISTPEADSVDVFLSWSKSVDLDGGSGFSHYHVYQDHAAGAWSLPDEVYDTFLVFENVAITTVAPCAYRYKIQPVDKINNERVHDDQVVCLTVLPAPDSAVAQSKHSAVWRYPSGHAVDSFCVERSVSRKDLDSTFMDQVVIGARKWADGSDREITFQQISAYENADTVYFHLKAVWGNFESGWSGIFTYPPGEGSVSGMAGDDEAPSSFSLNQNEPNPFNPATRIAFDVPKACAVTLKIFNIKGQLVRTLVNRTLSPSHYVIVWDGMDSQGVAVATGMYFYRLQAGDFSVSKKMLLLR
ncbi:MAG: T9SS type A sorting domain-containing protein, partial [Candidatus Zixiibacteriota bacterium]